MADPKITSYRDLAAYIDRRGVLRLAVAEAMGIDPVVLSRTLRADPEGKPSPHYVKQVMDALDRLARGEVRS